MPSFQPNLCARDVDVCLRESLDELRVAEKNAVLWFAEVLNRKLYRELGHSSIHQYAALALGFGKSKTSQFIRLAESLESLPALKESLSVGELSWTKAREVAKVATAKTEEVWIARAKAVSRRALELEVVESRKQARAAVNGTRSQGRLEVEANTPGEGVPGSGSETRPVVNGGSTETRLVARGSTVEVMEAEAEPEVPVSLGLRLSPEQYARYEALLEKLRKQGHRGSREELFLAGLEMMVQDGGLGSGDREEGKRGSSEGQGAGGGEESGREQDTARDGADGDGEFTRVNRTSPYQVVVKMCEGCGRGEVVTSRGPKKVGQATLRAILCDARVRRPGERNRSTIPPGLRQRVLARDGYRCRSAGCSSARFLAVHHLRPREVGGAHTLENLVTLCSGCHQALHRVGG